MKISHFCLKVDKKQKRKNEDDTGRRISIPIYELISNQCFYIFLQLSKLSLHLPKHVSAKMI